MKILALDASTEACSAAVYVNGEIIERLAVMPRKHIELLMPMIKEVMSESELTFSELDGLAFTAGPGSFAGLRIACGFVQGLGSGLNLPIVPVSTLATLALPILDEYPTKNALPIMDAKINEVYWALYHKNEDGKILVAKPDQVSSLKDLYSALSDDQKLNIIGVGDGWQLDPKILEHFPLAKITDQRHPRAGDVALLAISDLEQGLGLYADQVSPIYLRNNIALTIEEQKAFREAKIAAENSVDEVVEE